MRQRVREGFPRHFGPAKAHALYTLIHPIARCDVTHCTNIQLLACTRPVLAGADTHAHMRASTRTREEHILLRAEELIAESSTGTARGTG